MAGADRSGDFRRSELRALVSEAFAVQEQEAWPDSRSAPSWSSSAVYRTGSRRAAAAGAIASLGLFALDERGYFWLVVMLTPTALMMLSIADFQGFRVGSSGR